MHLLSRVPPRHTASGLVGRRGLNVHFLRCLRFPVCGRPAPPRERHTATLGGRVVCRCFGWLRLASARTSFRTLRSARLPSVFYIHTCPVRQAASGRPAGQPVRLSLFVRGDAGGAPGGAPDALLLPAAHRPVSPVIVLLLLLLPARKWHSAPSGETTGPAGRGGAINIGVAEPRCEEARCHIAPLLRGAEGAPARLRIMAHRRAARAYWQAGTDGPGPQRCARIATVQFLVLLIGRHLSPAVVQRSAKRLLVQSVCPNGRPAMTRAFP